LRDHGGAEQVVLPQAAFGNGQKKLIGHLQLGRDRRIARGGGEGNEGGDNTDGDGHQLLIKK